MKKKLLSLLAAGALAVSMLPSAVCSAEPEIPADGLDLWLEADYGITTDDSGVVTAWESKVNGQGQDAPYILDQTSTTYGDANFVYSNPQISNTSSGKLAVGFYGKYLSTSALTSYKGEISVIMLTEAAEEKTNATLIETDSRGIKITHKTDKTYEVNSNSGGVSLGANKDGLSVLTVISADNTSALDTDNSYLKNVYTYQDNVKKSGPYATNTSNRVGYDTISKYQIGHRSMENVVACIVYKKALSDEERTQVYGYLYDKYIKEATNPVVQSAKINADGNEITIAFNKELSGEADGFAVYADGEEQSILSSQISGNNVILTLEASVQYGQTVKVSYTGTGLINAEGESADCFDDFTVDTSAVPAPESEIPVISYANTAIDGTAVQLTANMNLTGTPSASDFSVYDGAKTASIKSVELNDNIIILNLSEALSEDETKVSYSGTSLKNASNPLIALAVFENRIAERFSVPQYGLDLWLEADSGVETDDEGNVISWTSKTNATDGSAPYSLNQVSSASDAGYVKPTVISGRNGTESIYFKGKYLSTGTLSNSYQGPVSVIMLSKPHNSSNTGYLLETADERKIQIIRKDAGVSISNSSSGFSMGTAGEDYSVYTAVAQNASSVDSLGQPFKSINTWKDGVKVTSNAVTDESTRKGYDTITKYQIGHRCDDDIAAVLIYKRGISELERKAAEQYLYEKYIMDRPIQSDSIQYTYYASDGSSSETPVPGGKVIISGNAVNKSLQAYNNVKIIGASFADGILTDINTFDIAESRYGVSDSFTVSVNIPQTWTDGSINLYIWDGFETIRPLGERVIENLSLSE